MLFLFSISNALELWKVNHNLVYKSSQVNVFKNVKFLGEISSDWPNDLLGTNVHKTLESCW